MIARFCGSLAVLRCAQRMRPFALPAGRYAPSLSCARMATATGGTGTTAFRSFAFVPAPHENGSDAIAVWAPARPEPAPAKAGALHEFHRLHDVVAGTIAGGSPNGFLRDDMLGNFMVENYPWSFFLCPGKKQLPNPLRGNDIHPFGKGIA